MKRFFPSLLWILRKKFYSIDILHLEIHFFIPKFIMTISTKQLLHCSKIQHFFWLFPCRIDLVFRHRKKNSAKYASKATTKSIIIIKLVSIHIFIDHNNVMGIMKITLHNQNDTCESYPIYVSIHRQSSKVNFFLFCTTFSMQ